MNGQCHLPTRVFIGLGANLGQPERQLRDAVQRLAEVAVDTPAMSGLWRTAADGMAPGTPDFANAVATFETHATARELLTFLQAVEVEAGRPADHERYVSRPLDLDILLYGDDVIDEVGLTVPHPGMALRRFVLAPLAELSPTLDIPGQGRVSDLLETAPAMRIRPWSDNP